MSVTSRAEVVHGGSSACTSATRVARGRGRRRRRSGPGAGRPRRSCTVDVRGAGVDGADQRAGAAPRPRSPGRRRCRGCRRRAARAAVQNQPAGRRRSTPARDQLVEHAPRTGRRGSPRRRANSVELVGRSGSSAAAQHSCGAEHVRVRRVEDAWPRPAGRRSPPGGARGRCPAGRRGRRRPPATPRRERPARPACCHSEASVPGIAGQHDRVQAGDVEPELQGVGGGHARAARPDGQRRLQRAPLLGQVARRGRRRSARTSSSSAGLGQVPRTRRARSNSAPRRERTKASVRAPSTTRSASSRAASAPAARRTGASCSPRSAVSGGSHSANVRAPCGEASSVTAVDRQPDSRDADAAGSATVAEASTKTGVGAVRRAHPPQPAQHLRDVRAEQPAVGVALVDDHVAQPAQERRPPRVRRQDPAVQHVRVGQHPVGVRAHPVALLERGVAVEGGRRARRAAPARAARAAGRRPAPWSATGRAPAARSSVEQRGQRGQLVGQRLARRGAGGQHHRRPRVGELGGLGLVRPRRGRPPCRPAASRSGAGTQSGQSTRAARRGPGCVSTCVTGRLAGRHAEQQAVQEVAAPSRPRSPACGMLLHGLSACSARAIYRTSATDRSNRKQVDSRGALGLSPIGRRPSRRRRSAARSTSTPRRAQGEPHRAAAVRCRHASSST